VAKSSPSYVVIERYREVGKKDDTIEKLLAHEILVDMLRSLSRCDVSLPQVNSAFKVFFERELPIIETPERLAGNT